MTTFKLVEFNLRRVMRGAEGARVEVVYEDGSADLLWMSKGDIGRNMRIYGRQPELVKAHEAYRAPKPPTPAAKEKP